MVVRNVCPACGSDRYKKNGQTRHGKQHHQCKACERQFGATAEDRIIADEQRTLIEHLEAIRKPFSIVVHLSSSFLAVMKFRAAAWRESVQHQMEVTNLDHRCT